MPEQPSGKIRLATVADLLRIHEIAVAGWTPIFNRYRCIVGDRLWQDGWGGWQKTWVLFDSNTWHGRGIVTEIEGRVVGFATWAYPGSTLAEVGGNAVDPGWQGRGIGAAQIQWVVRRFREEGYPAAKVHTGMDPAHGPARAEYRKAGLRLGVTNSIYLNYLDEVARIPVRKGLRFRPAEPGDLGRVTEIAAAAWAPLYDGVRTRLGAEIFDLAFDNVLEKRQEELRKAAGDAPDKIRLVEEGGAITGFCLLAGEPKKRIGAIDTLAVAPDAQGRATGAGLCMDAFDVLRGQGYEYVRLRARLGEVTEPLRQMCWNVGLYRELPSIDYYALL